jgi:hypothetical protein
MSDIKRSDGLKTDIKVGDFVKIPRSIHSDNSQYYIVEDVNDGLLIVKHLEFGYRGSVSIYFAIKCDFNFSKDW